MKTMENQQCQKKCSLCLNRLNPSMFRECLKRGKKVLRSRCKECDKPKKIIVECSLCKKTYKKRDDRIEKRWTGFCRSCSTKEQIKKKPMPSLKTHGMTGTKIYNVWRGIIKRCTKLTHKSYNCYGGRGIKIHNEWMSFEVFLSWANKSGYKEGLSIERIDVNGDYEPKNCCWIPMAEQGKNKRTSIELGKGKKFNIETILEAKKELKNGSSAKDVSKKYGMSLGYAYQIKNDTAWSDVDNSGLLAP